MNPLYLLFLSFACGISAVILVWVNNPMSRVFWALMALWALVAVIPAIMLDFGMYLAQCKCYGAGERLVGWAERLCEYISGRHTQLMCPVYASRIKLLQDQPEKALCEAKRALNLHTDDEDRLTKRTNDLHEVNNWLPLFFALTAAGNACFALENYEAAEDYFNKAWEASGGYIGVLTTASISDLQSTIHADNLHSLAMIALHFGKLEKAERLFDRSTKLRRETPPLQPSADAFDEMWHGAVALFKGLTVQAAERTLCAASLLPKDLMSPQHFQVALNILRNLRRLNSPRASEVFDGLRKCLETQLHPFDLRLIESAPFEPQFQPAKAEVVNQSEEIYTVLSNIEERLAKRLPTDTFRSWQETFRASIARADANKLWVDFILWLLEDADEGAIKYVSEPEEREAIQHVAMLYRDGCADKAEWKLASGAAHGAAKSAARVTRGSSQSAKRGGTYEDTYEQSILAQSALSVAALAADASAYDSWDRAGLVIDIAASLVAKVALHKTKAATGKEAWRQAMKSAYVHISKKLLELSDIKTA